MPLRPLDSEARWRHKARNAVHTWLLAGGSLGLLALSAYVLGGPRGVFWALVAGGISLAVATRASPFIVLRLYGARRLTRSEAPEVVDLMAELARRAGLPSPPQLYYIPSRLMNAFAVGRPDESAIAITDGLLRGLSLRQLAGVLAHETSHIRNGDLRVMALADTVSRLTSIMSTVGLFIFFLNLPLAMASGVAVPWLGVLLLMAAPTIGGLLQLALSRAREYDADLDAAGLTGDPEGLAAALVTLERRRGALWERLMLPGARVPEPSLLRTHPRTEDRVRRLLSLRGAEPAYPRFDDARPSVARSFIPVVRAPRTHVTGVWY